MILIETVIYLAFVVTIIVTDRWRQKRAVEAAQQAIFYQMLDEYSQYVKGESEEYMAGYAFCIAKLGRIVMFGHKTDFVRINTHEDTNREE